MAIIAISRELAALGDETAHELATQLNYRFIDKSALEERMKTFGVTDYKFKKYDEKKPSFWASLSRDRDDYLHYLKSAILAEAGQGNTIFIGRGAGLILKSVPALFRVFLVAPPEIRLERVKSYFHCDDKRANQIIEQSDSDREGFYRYYFDIRWKEAVNYHLTLNTGHLHPALCAELIKYMRDKTATKEAEAENVQKIQELTLAQRIKHRILYEKQTPIHFLDITVSGSRVYLYGVANAQSLIETAVSYAKEMAPEASILSEIQVVQEYNVIP